MNKDIDIHVFYSINTSIFLFKMPVRYGFYLLLGNVFPDIPLAVFAAKCKLSPPEMQK